MPVRRLGVPFRLTPMFKINSRVRLLAGAYGALGTIREFWGTFVLVEFDSGRINWVRSWNIDLA